MYIYHQCSWSEKTIYYVQLSDDRFAEPCSDGAAAVCEALGVIGLGRRALRPRARGLQPPPGAFGAKQLSKNYQSAIFSQAPTNRAAGRRRWTPPLNPAQSPSGCHSLVSKLVVTDDDVDYVFVPHAFQARLARYKGTYHDDVREQEVYEQDAGSWIPIESSTSTTASISTMSCARKQQLMETTTDGSSNRLSEWVADPASGSKPAKPAGGFTRMASVAAKARLDRAAARERARATAPARERWAMSSSWSPREFRLAVQQSGAFESPL